MAATPLEETEEQTATPPAKPANPWLPVLAIIVLVPVLSGVMMQFMLVPAIRTAVAKQTLESAAAKKEAEKSAGASGANTAREYSCDFDSIVVNLSGAMGTRYLKITFTLVSTNPDLKKIIDGHRKQLLDVAINILSSRSLADLETPGSKNVIRGDLMANFNQVLNSDLITQIYFSDFVVQ